VSATNTRFLGGSKENQFLNPFYAQGSVFAASLIESILPSSFLNPILLPLIKQLICSKIHLFSPFSIWPSLIGKEYCKLLEKCLQRDLLPLGLYRNVEEEGREERYLVLANPPPSLVLQANDKVYVVESSREMRG